MRQSGSTIAAALFLAVAVAAAGEARAACGNSGAGFERWLEDFKREAAAQGVSRATIAGALEGVGYDPGVVARDRRQSVFSQSFLEFAGRMVAQYRLQKGGQLLNKYAATFARIEQQFGVPGPVIVAFWGLESDFGAGVGDMPTMRSLATLAWDCRRADEFRPQLLDALRIVERGDLRPDQMVGPWAGELGQTQFLASVYYQYAVDYDGDGRRDLMRSVPDVLASTANYLKALGWQAGQPWLQEVRAPATMQWDQADLAIEHPRAAWAKAGVAQADGRPLPSDKLSASLLLPMGRNGPAFLAYPNFRVYLQWNESLVYATTAAYFATRLAGAAPVRRGNGDIDVLSFSEIKELQQHLVRMGHDVGKVDGIIGAKTRAAVKAVQIKLDLPPDSYPTGELLARLRGR